MDSPHERSGTDRPDPSTVWPTLAAAAIAAAHIPLLWRYGQQLWLRPQYQFAPFALAAMAFLIWSRAGRWRPRWSSWGLAGVGCSLATLSAAAMLSSPWLAAVSFLMLAAVSLGGLPDRGKRRSLAYVALLLAVLIRPPLQWDAELSHGMQSATTRAASAWLHDHGYAHFRAGNILEFPTKTLMVEEACSGVQALFATLFLAVLLAVWRRRGVVHAFLLIASSFVWAAAANIARVSAIAVAWEAYGLDLSQGWRHDVFGHTMLMVSLLLLASVDQFLLLLLGPIPWVRYEAHDGANPLIGMWNGQWGEPADGSEIESEQESAAGPGAGAFVLSWLRWAWRLGANATGWAQATRIFGGAAAVAAVALLAVQALRTPAQLATTNLAQAQPPETLGPVPVAAFERGEIAAMGVQQSTWTIPMDGRRVMAVCDYPFRGWHPLLDCYRGNGWSIEERRTTPIVYDFSKPAWPCIEATMRKPSGEYGYVVFSFFDAEGEPIPPPDAAAPGASLANRLRMSGWLADDAYAQTVQVQLFAESPTPFDSDQRRKLVDLHRDVRSYLREHFQKHQASVSLKQAVSDQ